MSHNEKGGFRKQVKTTFEFQNEILYTKDFTDCND